MQLTLHLPPDSLPSELGGTLKVDHGAWLRNCFKSMTNRAGDLCDISIGPNPLFPQCEGLEPTSSISEADDRPEDISEAGPSEEDDDVEEIEEPVALQVESVVHRLVRYSDTRFSA